MLHVANTNNMNQCFKYVGKCFTMCAYNSGTENDHQNNSNYMYRRLRLLSACAYNAMVICTSQRGALIQVFDHVI